MPNHSPKSVVFPMLGFFWTNLWFALSVAFGSIEHPTDTALILWALIPGFPLIVVSVAWSRKRADTELLYVSRSASTSNGRSVLERYPNVD